MTKFTEIVVFQNPCIVSCGNAEKIKTSFEGHRVAERTLKRRGHVDHLRCRAFLRTGSRIQPLGIHWSRYDIELRTLKCHSRAGVPWILHPDRFAGIEQRFRTKIKR